MGSNLFYDKYLTIPYNIDKIPNSPEIHQLPTQTKNNLRIMSHLINFSAIRLNVVNPRSMSTYVKLKAIIGHILNNFGSVLIKFDLFYPI